MKNFLDKKLSDLLVQNKIAGMSVAVTDRNGVIYSGGFGVNSTERPNIPADDASLYRVASITKVITGFTVMKLCEDGVLSLDAPISHYVPWLKLGADAQNQITLYHLLSHTSGLPQEYTPDGPREESALEESMKKELSNVKLESFPGDGKYLYSNLGIRLASYIAQLKTGLPYTYLASKYVLLPLGMNNSTYDLRVAATYSLSLPHEEINGNLVPQHYIKENAARMAAGGLYSNTLDLLKLGRCIINSGVNDKGEAVLHKNTLQKMMSPISMARNDGIDGYGLTLMTDNYKDGIMTGHLGDASPYGAGLFVDVKKGFGAVVLMNTFCSELRTQIPKMILEML